MKRVLELVRVSTEGQADEDRAGIPAQRAANQRTAKAHGLRIVRSIEIVDVSGAAVLQSREMRTLLRLMEAPEIHGVLCKEFSRLMRPENFTDYALLQHFIDTETIRYLPDGPIDLATKSGRLLGTIRAAMAGLERREIVERMMDAKEAMRRAGKHPGGSVTLPYGVGYSKKQGWWYKPEAEKVKEAYRLFLGGKGYTEIARALNMPRTNVRLFLTNPIYMGWKVYDKKCDLSPQGYLPGKDGRQGNRRVIDRSPEEVIRVKVLPPLVSEKTFAEVARRIELKRQKHWRVRKGTTRRYTYNGFLTCGDCESLVYTYSSKYDFYVCKSHNPREKRNRKDRGLEPCTNRHMLRKKLEPKLNFLLGEKLLESSFLEMVVGAYNDSLSPGDSRPTIDQGAVSAKVGSLRQKRERVLDSYFEGVIDKVERDRRVDAIDRDIEAYQTMLLESATPDTRKKELDLDGMLAVLEPFMEWQFLEREDRRAILTALCPEIRVYQYAVKGITINLADARSGSYGGSQPKTRSSLSPGRRPR